MDGGIVVSAGDRRVGPAGEADAERRERAWLPPHRSFLLLALSAAISVMSVAGLAVLPVVGVLRRIRWPSKRPGRR